MSVWRTLLVLMLGVGSLSFVGCTPGQVVPTAVPIATETTPPDIRGTVRTWDFVDGEGSMLVEGQMADGVAMSAQVRVTGQTQIARQVRGTLEAGQITHLGAGQLVEVRFDGPVLESFPVQVTAGEVVIVEP